MKFLTVKTNALRRHADHAFTLNSKANPYALCDACAASECVARNTRTQCTAFIPVLRFAVSSGFTSGTQRNTIRIGQAWYTRLHPSQTIALWDALHQRLLYARVDAVYWDENKDALLEKHSAYNHMVQCGEVKKESFKALLESCSGTGFYRNARGLTAIYFTLI